MLETSMMNQIIRSPFFYVGDKYKLMPQLKKVFPQNIRFYIEPFVGGGSSFLNTTAQHYVLNDLNPYVVKLHEHLKSYSNDVDSFIDNLYSIIDLYGLSCSYRNITVPATLKKEFVKTYYSRYNKDAYKRLKESFNESQNLSELYLLLIYGFNHMIRFNSEGIFNLPVGNVDFNKNVYSSIIAYMQFIREHDVSFTNLDYESFLGSLDIGKEDFVYFDPPYLISESEYNKSWDESEEKRLCDFIDRLHEGGVKFGITNLINHKEKRNDIFFEWARKYKILNISSNYISFNDNSIKKSSREVYVTNV